MTTIDWASLQHAYGSAVDIPAHLVAARAAPAPADYRDDPWFSLWSALYHQDDVFPASYAAIPGLVELAELRRDAAGIEALFLAASIDLRRQQPGAPALDPQLAPAYHEARGKAALVCEHLRAVAGSADEARRVAVAEAVFGDDSARAVDLLEEDDREA